MGTVTGGGARPSINISGSIRGYRPSSSVTPTGASSGGTNSSSSTMDFTDFIVTPYDMDVYEGQEVTGSIGIAGAEIDTREWYEKAWDFAVSTGATVVEGVTMFTIGAIDVIDSVVDGGAYLLAGGMDLVGWDTGAAAVRNYAAFDWGDGLENAAFGENGLLKSVDDASFFKHDSEQMQFIREAGNKTGQFAAATALTVFTGGLATAGVGFLYGLGSSAENYYQEYGTDLTAGQNGMIFLNGGLNALSWYSQGKLGNGLIEIGKSVNLLGLQDVLAQMKTEVFNKEFVKSLFTPGNVIGNAIASLMQSGGDIGKIATKLYNGEDVTAEEWALLAGELCLYFGLNTLEDGARSYISGFKIDDDNAIKVAERLLDDNDKLSLEDILSINPESRQKVLDCLSPEEIAKGLEDLDPDTYRKVMDSLTQADKLKVIYAQAELAAQGKYNGFFVNFREHAELHTNEVRDYAVAIAMRTPGINVDEVFYGAQFHDLGMRGGVFELNGKFVPIDSLTKADMTMDDLESYIRNSNGWGKLDDTAMDQKMLEMFGIENWSANKDMSRLPEEIVDMAFSNKLAEIARSNHPLNSAIAILTEDVTPEGVDKNVVALLAMSHSKSTSGIRNFDNPEEWRSCIDKMSYALAESGMDPEEVDKITRGLYESIENPTTFKRLVDEALCIRDGDAMSLVPLVNGDTLMQTGDLSHVEYTGKAQLSGYDDLPTTPAAEQAGIIDTLYNKDGEQIGTVDNLFSKKTHAGELNVGFDSDYDGVDYIASATITDPTKAPFATLDSAFERAGEVATYSNCGERTFEIVLPKAMEGSDLAEWYDKQITDMANAEISKAAEKGYSTQQLIDFYNNSIKLVFR
mgnify:CR=1 FL=1